MKKIYVGGQYVCQVSEEDALWLRENLEALITEKPKGETKKPKGK